MSEYSNWYVIDGTTLVHEDEINWDGAEYEQCNVSCFMLPGDFDEDSAWTHLYAQGHIH